MRTFTINITMRNDLDLTQDITDLVIDLLCSRSIRYESVKVKEERD